MVREIAHPDLDGFRSFHVAKSDLDGNGHDSCPSDVSRKFDFIFLSGQPETI
jgi:hypothetical protein